MTVLVRVAVFLGALLLFLVEPMAAKQLLPVFGGSAAVWITCLVFFQVALLVAYLYAHLLAQRSARRWFYLHVALLAGATGCAALWASGWMPAAGAVSNHPLPAILWSLASSVGLPFMVLGATGPLMQVWLARVRTGGVPYRLFGWSNLASLLALVAYPGLLEPYVPLRVQRVLWCAGVALFSVLSAAIGSKVFRLTTDAPARVDTAGEGVTAPRVGAWTLALWFALALVGALQLSAVTEHLTRDVAAIPLLWVLPLAVYLATFVVAFDLPKALPRTLVAGLLAVLLVALGSFLTHPGMSLPIWLGIGLFLLELLTACLFCHTELYRRRPENTRPVTTFYLTIAAGGAAGAGLVGIAAPIIFRANYDLSITFALTAALLLWACWHEGPRQRLLWAAGTILLASFCVTLHGEYQRQQLQSVRNFYGSLRVTRSLSPGGEEMRVLEHGTVTHGSQIFSAERMRVPTTYYSPDSGVGLAMRLCCGERARRVGVVGLGVGTLAAYGRPGDTMRFYEINPAVQPIAENLFTYLRQSAAKVTIVSGDARAVLAGESPQRFDVLVVDAFSGDAIPLHLLTVEALALYRRHLAPGGVLAFHVSNQNVDLEPELAALAGRAGLLARGVTSAGDAASGAMQASWVLMTEDSALLRQPELAAREHALRRSSRVRPWTDDDSSLLPLVRW